MNTFRGIDSRSKRLLLVAVAALAIILLAACGDSGEDRGNFDPGPGEPGRPEDGQGPAPDARVAGERLHSIWPEVWSQHAPGVKSWEYKVNCMGRPASHTDPCFLSDLTSVTVEAPNGTVTELEHDFNTNEYSGEITRRWVRYGPPEGSLPERGDHVFRYWRGDELAFEQAVRYSSEPISYPTGVEWSRNGDDLLVSWAPPPEADSSMNYKAIIWQTDDTPPVLVSKQFDWDADSGVLEDVPLLEGGSYSLNVAIYFSDGYAYSEYVLFDWPAG